MALHGVRCTCALHLCVARSCVVDGIELWFIFGDYGLHRFTTDYCCCLLFTVVPLFHVERKKINTSYKYKLKFTGSLLL